MHTSSHQLQHTVGERFTEAQAIPNVAKLCANSQCSQCKQERVHGTLTWRQPQEQRVEGANRTKAGSVHWDSLVWLSAAELGTWLGQRLPKRFSKDKCRVFHSHFYFSRSLPSVDHWCLWRISLTDVHMRFRCPLVLLHEHIAQKWPHKPAF